MQSRKTEFYRFINGESVFIIPVYQRNYDWTKDNCQKLFCDIYDDMLLKSESNNKYDGGHFIGDFIFKVENRYNNIIVDGQQRLTTLMLMLKAIHDITCDEMLKRKIKTKFLVNEFAQDEVKVKLKPIKHDRQVYEKLITMDYFDAKKFDSLDLNSNIIRNYIFLRDLIDRYLTEDTFVNFIESIEQLVIIELSIENENPQLIFESINSTGKDLTNTDLIRNYLLMALESNDQEKMYDKYWAVIEELIGSNNMEMFMTHYLLLKLKANYMVISGKNQTLSSKSLYECFKKHFPNLNSAPVEEIEKLLTDLLRYAESYKSFVFSSMDAQPTNAVDKRLYELFYCLDQKDAAPHVMYLMDHLHSNMINQQTFMRVLNIFISYATRSIVCKKNGFRQQSALWLQKVEDELKMNSKIKKDLLDGKDGEYLSMWWKSFAINRGSFSFPKNNEFKETLENDELYGSINSKRCKYLLFKIEEFKNPKECLYFNEGTIEHIMPKTLSNEWKSALNARKDLVNYESCVDTFGNLTLTGYNSELSNDIFETKCENYRESNYCITRDVAKNKHWDSETIRARSSDLAEIALKLWPLPNEYNKKYNIDTGVTCTLNLDLNSFVGSKPDIVSVFGNEFEIASWIDFVDIVCKELYKKDSKLFIELMKTKKFPGKKQCIYEEKPDGVRALQICDNPPCYIMGYNHVEDNLSFVKDLLKFFDESLETNLSDEVWFTLRAD